MSRQIRRAVIPIAGWGTRMFPATKAVPKALFPVVDLDGYCKPIIQIIIEEALSAMGPDGQVCIVVQEGQQEEIEAYFKGDTLEVYTKKPELKILADRLKYIGDRLFFALQANQEGFGHAILCARHFVGNEPFFVFLGDHIYTTSHPQRLTPAAQVAQAFQTFGKSVTSLDVCDEATLHLNGVVTGTVDPTNSSLLNLTVAVEKPKPDFARQHLVHATLPAGNYYCFLGIDLLTPRVFEILQSNYDSGNRTHGELQLRDAMAQLMKEEGMYGLKIAGARHDTGIPHAYATAVAVYDKISLQPQK